MSAKVLAAQASNFTVAPQWTRKAALALRRLWKRWIPAVESAERLLAVEERIAIGPKKALFLVRCGNQHFLVASSGDTIGPLVELSPPKAAGRRRKECEA